MATRLQQLRAEAGAARLDLDLDVGICVACLGIVAIALSKATSPGLRVSSGA